jgi:hypothetical protein
MVKTWLSRPGNSTGCYSTICWILRGSPNVVIMSIWLDMASVADVLSTGEDSIGFASNNGRLLKLVDRADLGSVGDEP